MKVLTMYLPQYHQVKENDEWWGEGYTDWVSAKNAKVLYEGHYQPHVPMKNNYYDLTQKETLKWQADLMKKYGVDGQCIYHYWFKDGRQILERPAEILLESKEIDMPFCFSWANQSWANSWSAIKGAAVWCDDRETQKKKENASGLLLEQQYGGEKEWKIHFDYLLPFFKDERYIKIDNMPVFVLYQALHITVLPQMTKCWNQWACQAGFAGIYFVGASNKDNSLVNKVLYPAPQLALSPLFASKSFDSDLRVLQYKEVWDVTIESALTIEDGTVGAFVGYDDSPRRGKRGCIIDNATPELFKEYLTKLVAINAYHEEQFTFINAWNEWGEGMHLEPDEKWGEKYLEAIPYAKSHYKEVQKTLFSRKKECIDETKKIMDIYREKIRKYEGYWRLFDKWLLMKERGECISDILKYRNINKVIINGLGMVGKHLVKDLLDGNIEILYGIDRTGDNGQFDFKVYMPDEIPESKDLIIITVDHEFEAIKKRLIDSGHNGEIVSIASLVNK
mgnify:CR=1 FL=1